VRDSTPYIGRGCAAQNVSITGTQFHLITQTFTVPQIPGAEGFFYDSTNASPGVHRPGFLAAVVFAKGAYCVVLTTQGDAANVRDAGRSLAVGLATVQAGRLPG
jgi:hypothetical protein